MTEPSATISGEEAEAFDLGAARILEEAIDVDGPQVARQTEAGGLDEAGL